MGLPHVEALAMHLDLLPGLIAIVVVLLVLGAVMKLLKIAVIAVIAVIAAIAVALLGGARLNSADSTDRAATQTKSGTVTSVTDGDTLTITENDGSRLTVRILGIDTPETRSGPVECGGPEASTAMNGLADGEPVTVKPEPESGDIVDKHGRYLGYVRTRYGVDLGERQLRAGLARIYQFDGREFSRLRRYQKAQRAAQGENLGNWSKCAGDFHSATARR